MLLRSFVLWRLGSSDFLFLLEPLQGVFQSGRWVGDRGSHVGSIHGTVDSGFYVSGNVLITLALVNRGIGLLRSVEDGVQGFTAHLGRRANIVISAGDAGLSGRGCRSLAGGKNDVCAINAGLCQFGPVEALIPEDDKVWGIFIKAEAFKPFAGVVIPEFLLFRCETDLNGFAVGIGDGEFEFAVLGAAGEG